jgi:hypothetical protein
VAPPAAPSNLAATAVSGNQVKLTWTNSATNATGLKLYWSSDGVHWVQFATAGPAATAATWCGAAPGTTYSFRVTAYNALGESDPSNTASVTTPAPPAAPSNLAAAAVSASQVKLTWTDNATNETGFKLYRSSDGVNWVLFAQVGPNTTAYTWGGAAPGGTYYFRVRATNASGDSDPSSTASVTTPAA